MITAIQIENFKGIGRPVRVELRPITLLFGPNSAGKSTILHALHYAHEILARHNFDPDRTSHGGDTVDLGGFLRFVHGRDLQRVVRIRLDLDLEEIALPEILAEMYPASPLLNVNEGIDSLIHTGWVELEVQWSETLRAPVLRKYGIGINGREIGRIEASLDGAQVELCGICLDHEIVAHPDRTVLSDQRINSGSLDRIAEEAVQYEHGLTDLECERWRSQVRIPCPSGRKSALPRWGTELNLQWIDMGDDASDAINLGFRMSSLMVGIGQIAQNLVNDMRYLGPMRDVIPGNYEPPKYSERSRWARGLGAWDLLLSSDYALVDEVGKWLASDQKLDTGYSLRRQLIHELPEDSALMQALRQGTFPADVTDPGALLSALRTRVDLDLVDTRSGIQVNPADVGLGISQLLPVVVAALDSQRPRITAIEQPELHMHPRMEVELGDLFAQQASRNQIFLLESHSEHLMLRLLRRIEETHSGELPVGKPQLRPDQVSVVFVERTDNEVKISQLRIDETGEFIDRWPHGFFEERAEELF